MFILMAIYLLTSIAGQVFTDSTVKNRSLFVTLLAGTIVTGLATIGLEIDVPD